VAKDYHSRRASESEGLRGVDQLRVDIPSVLRHVRSLRDHFAGNMPEVTNRRTKDHLITGTAEIIGSNRLRVGTREFETKSIVIATGARPIVPDLWKHFDDRILTSGNIFEQEDLPKRIAVIGLGPIGLEFGQSLSRLGIEIIGFDMKDSIATITDPDINAESLQILRKEFPIHLGARGELEDRDSGLLMKQDDLDITVYAAVVAVGIKPNLQGLSIENLGVPLDKYGMPSFDAHTMQIDDLPIFDAKYTEILGAELICPGGEHLAHQLALAIQQNLNIFDMLQMPFYHPTIEKGLCTAIQHAAKQVSEKHKPLALSLCGNCPESPLC